MRPALELKVEVVKVDMVVAEAGAGGTDEAKRAVAMNVDEVFKNL
jgi:hypothetical protein